MTDRIAAGIIRHAIDESKLYGDIDYPYVVTLRISEARLVLSEIDRLRAALTEARRWIGDGECADGLGRDAWTPEYAAAVAMVDEALGKNDP